MQRREYTAGSLIAAYRWAVGNPDGRIQIDRFEVLTGTEWLRWFRGCLHEKTSRGLVRVGRKYSRDWYCEARRTAREVNSRCVVRWVPFEFRERLAHRIFTEGD
jgi:hypothetical protein